MSDSKNKIKISNFEVEATQETVDTISKGIDKTFNTVLKGIDQTIGPLAISIFQSLTDISEFARHNLNIILAKAQQKIDSNLTNEEDCISINQIYYKEIYSMLHYASLESNETIQDMWASLIANSFNSNTESENTFIFMNILKELTPFQAKLLEFYYEYIDNKKRKTTTLDKIMKAVVVKNKVLEHFGIDEDRFTFNISCLVRLGLIMQSDTPNQVVVGGGTVPTGYNKTTLTPIGFEFVKICMSDEN